MAVARDFKGGRNHVIAVIGDGAMSAGMAYEALNNAGALKSRLIVVLNDNQMSIAPPVGAMSDYFRAHAEDAARSELLRGAGLQTYRPVDGHDLTRSCLCSNSCATTKIAARSSCTS